MTIENNNDSSGNESIDGVIDSTLGGTPDTQNNDGAQNGGTTDAAAGTQDATGKPQQTGKPTNTGPSGSGRTQPGQQQRQTTQPTGGGRATTDAKGNVVDAQGNILVAAGPARRIYEQGLRAQQVTTQLTRRAEQAEARVEAYEHAHAQFTEWQMGMDDVVLGAKILRAFRQDPQKTIEFLLNQAQAQGKTITLGGGAAPLTPDAIGKMIEQKLSPLLSDRAERQQQQQVNEEVEQAYNDFAQQYPEALMHEDVIATLMMQAKAQTGRNITPEAAWLQVQLFATRNGLDLSKPLQAQFDAKNGSTGGMPRQPLPNGRSGNAKALNGATTSARASAKSGDIVRDAMREAGMQF